MISYLDLKYPVYNLYNNDLLIMWYNTDHKGFTNRPISVFPELTEIQLGWPRKCAAISVTYLATFINQELGVISFTHSSTVG